MVIGMETAQRLNKDHGTFPCSLATVSGPKQAVLGYPEHSVSW